MYVYRKNTMEITRKQQSAFNMIESKIKIDETINTYLECVKCNNELFQPQMIEDDKTMEMYNNFRLFYLSMAKSYEYLKKRDIKSMKKCFKLLKNLRNKLFEKLEELKLNDGTYLELSNILMKNYKTFQEFQNVIERIETMTS